jgi:hypothetical protein
MVHYGVKPTAHCFLPVPQNYHVGPPYGKAYGYWKKHKHNPKYEVRLSNEEIANLVYLNVLHNHFGTPVVDLMKHRQGGQSFTVIVNNEYNRKMKNKGPSHCSCPEHENNREKKPGKEKGKGNGHNKK